MKDFSCKFEGITMVWVHNSANLLLLYVIFLEVSLQGDCHNSAHSLLMSVVNKSKNILKQLHDLVE